MTVKHGKKVKEAHDMVKNVVGKNAKEEGKENEERVRRIDEEFEPMELNNNNMLVSPDFHTPFYDRKLLAALFKVAEEYGVKELAVPGDFFDCDAYTSFLRLSYIETFQHEIEHARVLLNKLGMHFKMIYFCRGNHEKRWMKVNNGMVNVRNLFSVVESDAKFEVTMDDHIFLNSGCEVWRLSHPTNFSPNPLSVASRLADKHHMNIFSAHGHQFAQGYDKSGEYQIVDGGGMFDVQQLEYLRNTTCYPSVHSGFYLIQDGDAYPFPGKNVNGRYR